MSLGIELRTLHRKLRTNQLYGTTLVPFISFYYY